MVLKRKKLTCAGDISTGTDLTALQPPTHIVMNGSGETPRLEEDEGITRYYINRSIWVLFGAQPIVMNKIPRTSVIADYIIKDANLDNEDVAEQEKFWDEWGEQVYKMMRHKRNYVTSEIKKKMMGKLTKD